MNCQQVRPVLLDYLLEEVSAEDRTEVQRHLEQCATCSEEAGRSRQTLGQLVRGAPLEEIPQRIRLVAEPSSRWAAFWLNPARVAFAAGAFACAAIALLALFRTTISYAPGHFEIAFGGSTAVVGPPGDGSVAATPASADRALSREEIGQLVVEAVAASEARQRSEAQRLVQTVAREAEEQRVRDWRDMAESLRIFQAAQVAMWKQQVQSDQYVSALMRQSGMELPVRQ